MRTNQKIRKFSKKFWFIPIISFVAAIIIQIFLQDVLYDKSVEIIIKAQEKMNDSFGVDDPGKENNTRDIIFWIFYALTGNYFYFVMIGFIYNFVNVYKAFVLALSIYISNLVSALLGLIYHAPRPFMVNYKIVPYIKVGEWGMPNPQIITVIGFYCTFYKVIAKHRPLKKKTVAKFFIGLLFAIICCVVILIQFLAGVVTFDQIIVSLLLGFTVYAVMFFIFKAKINNAAEFYGIVKSKFLFYLVLNLIAILFLIILYVYIDYDEEKDFFEKHLKEQFDRLNPNYVDKNLFLSFTLSEGTFTNALCFFSNIVAIIALKIELGVTYNNDFETWKKENFDDKKLSQKDDNLVFSENRYSQTTQWNHTSGGKVFARLLICLVLGLAPALLFLIPVKDIPKVIRLILFSFLIYCYYSFGIFFLFKKLYKYLGLHNKVISLSSFDEI